jgi:ABC-2 type transport system permease protein
MFIAWFFTVIFILMSGLFTLSSMPNWAQQVTLFNPIRYFVEIIRMVMLKSHLFRHFKTIFIIAFYAFIINGFAVLSYKNQLKILRTVFPVRCFYLNLSN